METEYFCLIGDCFQLQVVVWSYIHFLSFVSDRFTEYHPQTIYFFPKQAIIKPQYVDHIPKAVQGNVGQVLDQKDERDMKKELCVDLELNQVLDRGVGDLSGGELQRFAIAVVAIQNAEIFMFDEPSSYLDVKQRLKAAQVIRSLLRPNRSSNFLPACTRFYNLLLTSYVKELLTNCMCLWICNTFSVTSLWWSMISVYWTIYQTSFAVYMGNLVHMVL